MVIGPSGVQLKSNRASNFKIVLARIRSARSILTRAPWSITFPYFDFVCLRTFSLIRRSEEANFLLAIYKLDEAYSLKLSGVLCFEQGNRMHCFSSPSTVGTSQKKTNFVQKLLLLCYKRIGSCFTELSKPFISSYGYVLRKSGEHREGAWVALGFASSNTGVHFSRALQASHMHPETP